MLPLLEVVKAWHDLFMLFGTASATLIGLLFVAASVGSSFYDEKKHQALRSFLSPSVVHFSCVLAASLIAVCPWRSGIVFGLLIAADGVFGVVYSISVLRRMVGSGLAATIDLEDRLWYAAIPAVGYVIMSVAGLALLSRIEPGCEILTVSMGLLLLAGIRNAWDMTVWTVMRPPA